MGALLVTNSKIAVIVDIANLILEFSIPEKYVTNKLIGANAFFTVEGMSKKFPATVYAMDPEVDIKTRSIMLRARYHNREGLLRPGMYAKVSLSTEKRDINIYLPNEAIVQDVKGRSVWFLKEGKAAMVQVQTGTRTTDKMEILSGVQKGDTIITTGLMQLREGMAVSPTNI